MHETDITDTKVPQLTPREIQALRLRFAGLRPKDICKELSIAPSTLETHTANTKKKLDANTIEQVIAKAILYNLLETPE